MTCAKHVNLKDFPISKHIEHFFNLNKRGWEIRSLYRLQNERINNKLIEDSSKSLSTIVADALRISTLGPFLHEFNEQAGPPCFESQVANLDMLKFSYCKGGESSWLDKQASIFPHIQYAIHFIETVLQEHTDGKISIEDVFAKLTVLYLHNKDIASLDATLEKFQKLKYLNLAWNLIDSMAMFEIPPRLVYLNLEMNLLSDFILCQSRLSTPDLVYLNLSRNQLSDSSDLGMLNLLLRLLMLDLSYNNIQDLNSLWQMLDMSRIQSLNLIGNPCSVSKQYFVNVVTHVPCLGYLDCVSIPDYIKNKIQVKDNLLQQLDGELCIHCYRVMQFKYVDDNALRPVSDPSVPEKNSFVSIKRPKKSNKKKDLDIIEKEPKKSKVMKNEKPLAKSGEDGESKHLNEPALELKYRFEVECPILNETFHDFVDYVKRPENKHSRVPNEILTRIYDLHQKQLGLGEHDIDIPANMKVKEAKTLLETFEHNKESVNAVFMTTFTSNLLPESDLMEFSPIFIKPPHNNLTLLSNAFYTQWKLHFVQLQMLVQNKPVHSVHTEKVLKESKKLQKKEVMNDSPNQNVEPIILERNVLYTILLDELIEPTWDQQATDFVWTHSELKPGYNLKNLHYDTIQAPMRMKRRESIVSKPVETNLPEELTMHFGISLVRDH